MKWEDLEVIRRCNKDQVRHILEKIYNSLQNYITIVHLQLHVQTKPDNVVMTT
jgi:hypothetical protein